ncbi:ParB/RepB/Spo0J family partition protein [Halobacillus sp. ACCC02827]|uniref:ParB/RepB/Spo0J family partition protein n=1 Tax=Bacillaceae TaxID=186817 RepID=UPI0004152D82|nr:MULTISPECIES: ParB/RepB/Spo0J family partition protein [Bacillaceae]QHT45031.1 ParB/RepB/Spo0J family partition protein [Bacillus sp. SB49]WJE15805.1 ParB/RepB/Spo0J family partition protein [Halobacillus sp. ACCC02827]
MERGLGKGLDALITNTENIDDKQLETIAIKDCRPNPYQPRKYFDDESLSGLKQSIEEHGILQPLVVRQSIKGYEIVVGERRYRAAKLAELETIPAIIQPLTDEQMMELALLENLQREDLTPIEEAKSYEQLIRELDVTQEMLANRLGKSRSHIANLIRLLALPRQVTAKINDGTLSMGHGRALLGLKDKDVQLKLVDRIERESLNVRQVEQIIQEINRNGRKQKPKQEAQDIFLREQETSLKERLGTGVKIHKGKRKGKIEIEFMNEDDLERILAYFDKEKE